MLFRSRSNAAFALQVEPRNAELQTRARQVDRLRAAGKITLPTRLSDELATNPFLRTREDGVIQAARKIDPEAMSGVSTMAVIRAWKDRF